MVASLAFSPDGTRLLTGTSTGVLTLWDAASAAAVRTYGGHPAGVSTVAFAPDGKRFLTVAFDGSVRVWHTEFGRQTLALDPDTDAARVVPAGTGATSLFSTPLAAFSPDGQRIAAINNQGSLVVYPAATEAEIRRWMAAEAKARPRGRIGGTD